MSTEVRQMFSSIARRYDVTNEVLSFGIHRLWRDKAVKLSGAAPGLSVLDCATGTGDLAMVFKQKVGSNGKVLGTDFCPEMLETAPAKALYRRPRHPYTRALLAASPSLDGEGHHRRAPLQGELPSPLAPPPGCTFHPRCPFAVDRCRAEAPPLRDLGEGVAARCWRAEEIEATGGLLATAHA